MLFRRSVAIALSLVFLFQTVWSTPVALAQSLQAETFPSFTDLCLQRLSLPAMTQQTIAILLQKAQTSSLVGSLTSVYCDRSSTSQTSISA